MASGQPPDYVQTMRMQQVGPQQTNQYQQGYNLYNQDLTNLVQQQQFNPIQINSTQQLQNVVHQQNVQGYHSPAPMRAQPQSQIQVSGYCQDTYANHNQTYTERRQNDQSYTESDPMKRQKTEHLTKKLRGTRRRLVILLKVTSHMEL